MKIFSTFLFVLLAVNNLFTQVPLREGDRIGWSSDGNEHDSDDWGATAIALAMFAKAGLQDRLVHFDYGSWLPDNTPDKYAENIKSTLGGAQRFNFDRSKFFDDQTQLEEAVQNIAKEINASSVDSRFWYCVAGPFEVAYRGIKAADPEKRKFCKLVSHSPGNERPRESWCHGGEDCEKLGVEFIRIKGGNGLDSRFGGGNSHNWEAVQWLKESPDEDYRWVWKRIRAGGQGKPESKRGALDASDGCMAYWLLTGDEDGDFQKLQEMLGSEWNVPGMYITSNLYGQMQQPNIILIMADDQGWGQVGYNGHPVLKTPNLDAMAEAGLRFNRFYAAGPVCSPTRASVLTGRSPNRTGVPGHGYNLCLQEKTLAQALKKAGYTTALFGKWHLNGVRGAGVPILIDDPNHPGLYGFDEWIGVTNFFDRNPLMSRNGQFEEYNGDGSEVVVSEALKFLASQKEKGRPFFTLIWYGSPHNPWIASEEDQNGFPEGRLGHHLGELVALDRSIGSLRQGLRDLGIEMNTLVWYCSDNGGLEIDPDAVGYLKGHKSEVFEGGIRVPGIVEWPGHIKPIITDFPASTMDIMPTIIELLDLPEDSQFSVRDGESLMTLFNGGIPERKHPIPFYFQNKVALIDGDYKILSINIRTDTEWKMYDLKNDPGESMDLSGKFPERFEKMKSEAKTVIISMDESASGRDYPEGIVSQPPRSAFWYELEAYKPYYEMFLKRPEYAGYKNRIEL